MATDPIVAAAAMAANRALGQLHRLVEGTQLECGLQDVLDPWDAFFDQFSGSPEPDGTATALQPVLDLVRGHGDRLANAVDELVGLSDRVSAIEDGLDQIREQHEEANVGSLAH